MNVNARIIVSALHVENFAIRAKYSVGVIDGAFTQSNALDVVMAVFGNVSLYVSGGKRPLRKHINN